MVTAPATTTPVNVVTAINLDTQEEKTYACSAREAAMAAHAQAIGDCSTWEYEKRYGEFVQETRFGWVAGQWWVRDPAKKEKNIPSQTIKRDVDESHVVDSEDRGLIAPNTNRVCTHIYDVEETGYIVNTRGRKFIDILKDLNTKMRAMPWPKDTDYEGFTYCYNAGDDDRGKHVVFPTHYRWIACFCVAGGNEGHYVHLELIHRNDSRQLVFLCKTFYGRAHGELLAIRAAALLGA